jgi:hypothetical protein
MPQFQERHGSLVNKGWISDFEVLRLVKKQCQKRHSGTIKVPSGTVGMA